MKNFTVIVFNLINLCIYLFISLSYHLPHFRVMWLIAYVTNFLFFFFYFFRWISLLTRPRYTSRVKVSDCKVFPSRSPQAPDHFLHSSPLSLQPTSSSSNTR